MAGDKGFEAVVPSTPRSGSYLTVTGFSEQEGGGDVRVELTCCPNCYAAVEQAHLNEHQATHEVAPPPESGPKSR
jgi:hypothetical protein